VHEIPFTKEPFWACYLKNTSWSFQQTCVHEITSWSVMNKTGFAIRGRAWWTAAPLKPRTTIDTRGGQRWSKVKRCERKILCIVQARHCAVVDCCFLVEFVSQCKVSAHHASPYRMVSYTPLQLHYVMIATSSSRHNIKQSCLVWQRICSHCIRHHLKPITNHQSPIWMTILMTGIISAFKTGVRAFVTNWINLNERVLLALSPPSESPCDHLPPHQVDRPLSPVDISTPSTGVNVSHTIVKKVCGCPFLCSGLELGLRESNHMG
jgi:hypothetical protein